MVLTRYAAQSLYAPLRTVEPVSGLSRGNLRRDLALDVVAHFTGTCQALAAWRLEDQWVTAVRLTNTASRWLDLDREPCKEISLAATFQHPDLGPSWRVSGHHGGISGDRGHGLAESLLPAISPIDAPQPAGSRCLATRR